MKHAIPNNGRNNFREMEKEKDRKAADLILSLDCIDGAIVNDLLMPLTRYLSPTLYNDVAQAH